MSWTGRFDGEGAQHARWHQLIRAEVPDGEHVSLLGFASDEGVRRNGGRVGAAAAPNALRGALGSMALHGRWAGGERALVDLGTVTVAGAELEAGQESCGQLVARSLAAPGNLLTVVLGGGHETAWASYLGLIGSGHMTSRRFGVLNLDAHFDLRDAPEPTSGTPFLQMARAEEAAGRKLHYGVLGISEAANTGALFAEADRRDVDFLLDLDCTPERALSFAENFVAGVDDVYLTVDLDVLPAWAAPGVSAPAALGVEARSVLQVVRAVARSGKLRLLDVVELNPRFDVDGRTARAAARIVSEAVHALG